MTTIVLCKNENVKLTNNIFTIKENKDKNLVN